MNDPNPNLEPTPGEHLRPLVRTGARVAAGLFLPGLAMAVFDELINQILPNQAHDRIERYLRQMHDRLCKLEQNKLEEILAVPENRGLIWEGMLQSARATSEDRIEYLAKLVTDGITDEHLDHMHSRKLLNILGDLDDSEVIFLLGQFSDTPEDYQERHSRILKEPEPSAGDKTPSEVMYQASRDKLIRMGLLIQPEGRRFPFVTDLGRLFLQRIERPGSR
jgi:hypothetical protein